MKMQIALWLWRLALLSAIAWVGIEVHGLRQAVESDSTDQTSAEAQPDPLQQDIADLRDDLAGLSRKVDALMIAMLERR
jgi:hypothetical protein